MAFYTTPAPNLTYSHNFPPPQIFFSNPLFFFSFPRFSSFSSRFLSLDSTFSLFYFPIFPLNFLSSLFFPSLFFFPFPSLSLLSAFLLLSSIYPPSLAVLLYIPLSLSLSQLHSLFLAPCLLFSLSLVPIKHKVLFFYQNQQHWNTNKVSKVGDRSRGRPEGSLFNSYYTEV